MFFRTLALGASVWISAGAAGATAINTDTPNTVSTLATPDTDEQCPQGAPFEVARAGQIIAPATKSAAILGGTSKLEQMRRAQEAADAPLQLAEEEGAPHRIEPALAPLPAASPRPDCNRLQFAIPGTGFQPNSSSNPNDFLGSRRLSVKKTSFDHEWHRVSHSQLSRSTANQLVGSTGKGREGLLRQVNGWVNSNIEYAEDSVLWGRADYWADARTTLGRGKGDCEDFAILKMQLLIAFGIPREDIFLTIARDLVRNADHALLVVRLGNRHYLLDNSTDAVLDASSSLDYRPIFSFSEDRRWIHGYEFRPQRSVIASSKAFSTGLKR